MQKSYFSKLQKQTAKLLVIIMLMQYILAIPIYATEVPVNGNVEISANLNGQKIAKDFSINLDVNAQNILNLEIDNNSGNDFIAGKIVLEENDKANYKFKTKELAKELVAKVEENQVILNNLKTGKHTIKIPIIYIHEGDKKKENLEDNFKIKLVGKTTKESENVDKEIEKLFEGKIFWNEEKNISMQNNITKYIPISNIDKNRIIIQNEIYLTGDEKNKLPIEKYTLNSVMPKIDNKFPKTVDISILEVTGLNEKTIDNKEETEEVIKKVEYISETGELKIALNNKELSNDVLRLGNGKIKILVSSEYEVDKINPSYSLKNKYQIERKLYNVESKKFDYEITTELNEKIGEIVSVNTLYNKDKIYKSELMLNKLQAEENKIPTEVSSTTVINISIKEELSKLRFNDEIAKYNNNAEDLEKNIIYKNISIEKSEFDNLFGETGELKLISNNEQIGVINKNSTKENEKYIYEFVAPINNLQIETSEIKNNGTLKLEKTKQIKDSKYNIENFKELKSINFKETISKIEKVQNEEVQILIGILENEIKLEETSTNITISSSNQKLTTLDINRNIELIVSLNNDKLESDIYGNTILEVILPNEITEFELKSVNIIYGDFFKVSEYKVVEINGVKKIQIKLSGMQTNLSKGHLTNGTTIIINTDIKLNPYITNEKLEYGIIYSNSLRNKYETEVEFSLVEAEEFRNFGNGYSKNEFEIITPKGVIISNKVVNASNEVKEITTFKQGPKEIVLNKEEPSREILHESKIINNTDSAIESLHILGHVPSVGSIEMVNGSVLDNNFNMRLKELIVNTNKSYKVYYTTNPGATADLSNPNNLWTESLEIPNVKNYLLVFNEEIEKGEMIDVYAKMYIPERLGYNKKASLNTSAYYKQKANLENVYLDNSDYIIFKTEEGLELEGELVPEANIAKKLSNVIYELRLKNKSNIIGTNVKATIPMPKGIVVNKIYTGSVDIPFSRDINGNISINLNELQQLRRN